MPGEVARAHRHPPRRCAYYRGRGRLHDRQRRRHSDVAGRSGAHAQLGLARPRQRHRCADDLAGRPGYPAGPPPRGGFYWRVLGMRPSRRRGSLGPSRSTAMGGCGRRGSGYLARYSPLIYFAMAETRAALERMVAVHSGSPFDGVIIEYTNPVPTGRPCQPWPASSSCFGRVSGPRPTANRQRELPRDRGPGLFDGRRPAPGLGRQGRFLRAQLDLSRTCKQQPPTRLPVQLHRPPVMKALNLFREETKAP